MTTVMEEEQIKPWMAGASWRSWQSFFKARLVQASGGSI